MATTFWRRCWAGVVRGFRIIIIKKTQHRFDFNHHFRNHVYLCLDLEIIKVDSSNPPIQKTNLPSRADPLGKVENTTPVEEITIRTLEDKQKSGQRLTLIERQILLAHKSQKKHFPESSIKGETSIVTQQYFLNLLFETSDIEHEIKSEEEPIKMAEEGNGLERGPPNQGEEEESTFKFPIHEPEDNHDEEIKMKNIPPSVLPNFYGMASEEPDSFLFEFDIVCRTYGYTDDAHRLRLFPATLKASALKWFMGIGEHAITNWDGMRRIFLRKYQPYCRSKDSKDDIFRMNQQEDESLEEYLERFTYNLQKLKHRSMILDLIRTIFLRGIREEYLDDLNLMDKGDISTLPFEEIAELCEKYSRSKAKIGKRTISSKATKSASTSITRAEIGNLLEEFKTDLLSTLGTQIDTLKAKKRQEEEDQMMVVFSPKCRKKHALKDCPLENIQVCAFCTKNHDIFHCSKVKVLQNSNVAANTNMENVYFMGAKRPWQPRPPPQDMFPNQNLQFPAHDQMYAQNSWNVPMPWQHQNYSQQQWRPSQQYSQQYQSYPQPYQPYSQSYQQYHQPYSPYPQSYQQYPQQQVV